MMFSALLLAIGLSSPAPVPTAQSLPAVTLRAPAAKLRVQIAHTEEQRERGLMGVTHLARHTGMVFVFDADAKVAFWMKDTLIPLDMVFISDQGVVREVYSKVPVVPLSLPDNQIPLEQGQAKYVIELASGEAEQDGLVPGAHVGGLPGARTP